MDILGIQIFAFIGFLLAAYSIVANDAIQTLGTFLSSNSLRPWWVLWLYACSIIVAVMVYGYVAGEGDIAYGRLNSLPYPENGIQWWHAVPPLFLMILTRFGIPVSTTFLVLTIFALTGGTATEDVLPKMLLKSGMGYVVAFFVGALVYFTVAHMFESWIAKTRSQHIGNHWVALQWLSTAFLWSQWLIQDLANIFVFLPRQTVTNPDGTLSVSFTPELLLFATVVMLALHAIIFATRGGEIQKIVLSKANTTDIRAATLIDFIYALTLMFFKDISNVPMSTTWVFLGLLAGRELAISARTHLRERGEAAFDVVTDIVRAFIGLIVSVIIAVAIPWIATGRAPNILGG